MDYNKLYELWVEKTADNEEIAAELKAVCGKDKEIEDRFTVNWNSVLPVSAVFSVPVPTV